MATVWDDINKRVDDIKARAKQQQLEEAQKRAQREAQKLEAQRRQNSSSILY